MKLLASSPIGVFDSGLGGISVLRELTKCMPNEDFIYLGDSINAPYGTKSLQVVRELTIGHIRELVEDHHVKAIAVACNTATSAAVRILRKMYPDLPLVGIEPALKPAALECDHARILVMATPRTLKEAKFHDLLRIYERRADIFPLPCPGLMEYVENGILSGPDITAFLEDLLAPGIESGLTSIVLGCTHYPFLRDIISRIAGPDIKLYDGGPGTARELLRRVTVSGLARKDTSHRGTITFYNTTNSPELLERSRYLYSYDNPEAKEHAIILKEVLHA